LAAVGVTVGATLALLVGRRFARDAVLAAMQDRPVFNGLEQALRTRGFLVVMLTRFSLLIPFTVLNYAYGVSSVALSRYVLATAVGMVPAVALYVYLGSVANDVDALLASNASGGGTGIAIMVVGVLAMVLATWVIHRTATAELRKHMSGPVTATESTRQTP
ncbi:MAG: VTT domain-containing protein, partial [Pseudomonadota bacterium]